MDVELRHLRALVAVGNRGTVTAAAAELGVTQPTLSRTLDRLEEIVGARLVERTTRRTGLTGRGRRLFEEASVLLARLDRALADAGASGPLRLGWAWAGLGEHTVPLLRGWRAVSAAEVEVRRPDDPEAGLLDGSLDAVIVRRVLPEEVSLPDTVTAHLFTETLVAGVPATGPLARRSSVGLAELAGETVALCATSPTVTLRVWDGAAVPERTVTVANTDEWLTRIAMGDAVGVTAAATSYGHRHPGVVYLPVRDSARVEVSLVWPASRPHPEVERFASFARRHFRRVIENGSPPTVLAL
ncbi:Hca operon transcriptional activator HcaR [Nocardiopsis dassonvillei]|uniref:LysR family transcriptional regulator n=1 Tax=Nocardiopsis dassonvillei TaxID=2014 RepID=UPI003F568FD9